MPEKGFKDIWQCCFDIKKELQKGSKTPVQCSLIIRKIFSLNATIDQMTEKDLRYYQFVEY